MFGEVRVQNLCQIQEKNLSAGSCTGHIRILYSQHQSTACNMPSYGGSMWILTISHKNKISPDATNFNHGFKGDRKTLFESSWIHSILQRYMMIIWCMDYVWVDDDSLVDAMVDAPMTSQPLVTLPIGSNWQLLFDNIVGFHRFHCFHVKISRWCSNDLGVSENGGYP